VGNGNGNAGGNGNGVAAGQGNGNGPSANSGPSVNAGHGNPGEVVGHPGHTVGGGRGTALTAPGSVHRSDNATARLSSPKPATPSGVTPGLGRVGTVPTTPGHQEPQTP
jgi:hypothetical protein